METAISSSPNTMAVSQGNFLGDYKTQTFWNLGVSYLVLFKMLSMQFSIHICIRSNPLKIQPHLLLKPTAFLDDLIYENVRKIKIILKIKMR
jgi:hypothetical protein